MTLDSTTPDDETRLIDEARAGSDAAFAELVDRYSERIYLVVHRIVRDRADAEEVTQETFLKAFRHLDRFQADSALYTWLYRIAVNAAVDLSKKERRRRHLSLDDDEQGLDSTLASNERTPDGEYHRTERIALVREGIEALPDNYRVILTLREYSDLSYEQLGEVLDLPKGTVESRLFRARAKLKEWLEWRLGADGLEQWVSD